MPVRRSGILHIQTDMPEFSVTLFDLSGRILYHGKGSSTLDISALNLSEGTYLMECAGNEHKVVRKFTVTEG